MSNITDSPKLDSQRAAWYERACQHIDVERFRRLVMNVVEQHSPTGAERAASEFMVAHMRSFGLDAHYQDLTPTSGNAIGIRKGTGDGPSLMLYAPIDTHFEANESLEVPWCGPSLRADMRPFAVRENDLVIGLGAANPKGMVAALTEAVNAVADADIPLRGDLILAFAGGGMPMIARERSHWGLSSGVSRMLTQGVQPDFGVIMKPWDYVYHEHPGLVWFKVSVRGTMGYAGIPRGTPGFRSSIVPAARVILELERWLENYPDQFLSAQVRPQGWISALRAGWPERVAFPSATTEIYLDLRITPDQSCASVKALFDDVMRGIMAHHSDVVADWEMIAAVPGSRVAPDNWIVRSCIRAWEHTHGQTYPGSPPMAGQTDAATICQLGVPLARIGFPDCPAELVPESLRDGLGGMGVVHVPSMMRPIRTAIYTLIDTCTRTRKEIVRA